MVFSSHNILLNNNRKTLRGEKVLLADSLVIKAVKKAIDLFIHENADTLNKMTAVDLGCMEGGYSLELARMGFNTLGIDARKEHLIKANYVKFKTIPGKLNFVLDDVRNLPKYGIFDVAFCFGLLYHLDKPAAFLKTVYGCTQKILILHSFYAPDEDHSFYNNIKHGLYKLTFGLFKNKYKKWFKENKKDFNRIPYLHHVKGNRLSEIAVNESYKGRWYNEWEKNATQDKIEKKGSASYNNHQSFWLCKNDLIKAVYDAGFSSVYEQLDDIGALSSKYPAKYYGRTMLIAIK